jgi:hypothetical protein
MRYMSSCPKTKPERGPITVYVDKSLEEKLAEGNNSNEAKKPEEAKPVDGKRPGDEDVSVEDKKPAEVKVDPKKPVMKKPVEA